MKKYKLIKEYPGFKIPDECHSIDGTNPFYCKNQGSIVNNPENYPEFWELVTKYIPKINDKVYRIWPSGNKTLGIIVECHGLKFKALENYSFEGGVQANDTYGIGDYKYELVIKSIEVKKEPLFKTEDDVDIYEGDEYYYLNNKMPFNGSMFTIHRVPSTLKINFDVAKSQGFVNFSTKKAAENWVKCHKPCLSLNEVLNIIQNQDDVDDIKKELTKLVKEKLHKS